MLIPTSRAIRFLAGRIDCGFTTGYAGPLHRGGHLRQYELHRHVESYSFSFGPSPFNFWPPRPRNSGYYDLCSLLAAAQRRCPFRHKASSPQVRTHAFTAQPPDIRRFALITRASRFLARSPCLAAPRIRFLFIGSQLTFHASFPLSVALVQLRFTSFAVINLWRDLQPQECAHAGRTKKPRA